MRKARTAATWAAGLLLLFLSLWLLMDSRENSDSARPQDERPVGEPPERASEKSAEEETDGTGNEDVLSEEQKLPPPVDLEAADRDLDLFGIVVDQEGDPMAGATVETIIYPWRRVTVLNVKGYYEETRGAAVRSARDGTFSLRLERGQLVHLRVSASGYARTELAHCIAGEFVQVELVPATVLEVVTVDEDGAPVKAVRVRYWSRDTSRPDGPAMDHREGVTDETGRWIVSDMRPGKGTLSFEHDLLGSPNWQFVEIPEGERYVLEIVMPRGRTIRGRVVDADTGEPIAGARIGSNWVMNRPVLSDADGNYSFPGWTGNGVNDLHATAEGYGRQGRVVPPEGDVDFALIPGHEATGQLVSGDGRPVAGAFVTAMASERHDGEQQIDSRSIRSDDEGHFLLTSLRSDLAHTLVVRAKGCGRYLLDFDQSLAEDGRIDLGVVELPSARAIEGTARDQDGRPFAGQTVVLDGHNQDRGRLRPGKEVAIDSFYARIESRRTDDLGRFRFPHLSPGDYTLSLRLSGSPKVDHQVTLPPDRDLLDVELTTHVGRSLTIVVEERSGEPVEDVSVTVAARGGPRARSRTDADGRAFFQGLGASEVQISLYAGDRYARVEPRRAVPGDQEVRFVVDPAARVEGRVVPPAGLSAERLLVYAVSSGDGERLASAFADQEGRFELVVPQGAVVDVVLAGTRLEGNRAEPADLRGARRGVSVPVSDLVIEAYPVARDRSLTIVVEDLEGQPVAGARFQISSETGAGLKATASEADGRFQVDNLPSETVHIRTAYPHPREEGILGPAPVAVIPDGQVIVLRYRRGVVLSGHIEDRVGNRVAAAHVQARLGSGETVPGAVSDASGSFSLTVPRGERVDLVAEHRSEGRVRRGVLEGLGEESREIVITLDR